MPKLFRHPTCKVVAMQSHLALGGFVDVIKITDPTKLPSYKSHGPINFKQGFRQGTNKQIADQGKVKIFQSNTQLCLSKFINDNKVYLVVFKTKPVAGDFVQLGIFAIENDSLKLSREIMSEYFDSSFYFGGSEDQPFVTYSTEKNTGFIDFSDGKAVFYNFPLKK